MTRFVFSMLVGVFAAFGCGSDGGELGAPTGVTAENVVSIGDLAKDTPFLRVDMKVTASNVEVLELEAVTLPGGTHRPQPVMTGTFILLAKAGDQIRESQLVRFTNAVISEDEDETGEIIRSEVRPLSSSLSTAFVVADPDLTELVVLDEAGNEVAEVTGPELAALLEPVSERSEGLIVGRREALGEPLAGYPHIRVLGEGDTDNVDPEFFDGGRAADKVVDPGERHLRVLKEAFDLMAPGPRSAVTTVVFVEYPNYADGAEKRGEASGSNLALNFRPSDSKIRAAIVHESIHNYVNLLNAAEGTLSNEAWPAIAREQVAKIFDGGYIRHGFTDTWVDVHDTGVDLGKAGDYVGSEGWKDVTDAGAITMGVTTRYASRNSAEDIAEMASAVQYRTTGDAELLCSRFAAESGADEFPVDLAIHFVKLNILKAVQAIDESAFDACTYGVEIEKNEGVHVGGNAFDTNPRVNIYESDGVDKFGVLGDFQDLNILIEVQIEDKETPPLGLHRLDGFSWSPANGVWLNAPSDVQDRVSKGGVVLITDVPTADTNFTRGAVFFLTFANAFGATTSQYEYVPFYVEQ